MVSSKLEYIWLDGYKPIQSLRSKTKIEKNFSGKLEDCPMWCFDGSSTEQAPGGSSDCLLKPVFIAKDPQRKNAYLVMCEVLSPDSTAHESNGRATIEDDDNDFWFGFEQEYFLWNPATNKPIGFPDGGFPGPQGPYYCSVGATNAYGRAMVEEHLDACLEAGLNVEGINAEVATGQWEFQIFAKGAKAAGDQVWVARYLLERIGEKYGIAINWHCKPLGNLDWNGSGMHANFSNELLRTCGSKEIYEQICEGFRPFVKEHIEVYGPDNHLPCLFFAKRKKVQAFPHISNAYLIYNYPFIQEFFACNTDTCIIRLDTFHQEPKKKCSNLYFYLFNMRITFLFIKIYFSRS